MSYRIEIRGNAEAIGAAERETFPEAIGVARRMKAKWPDCIVHIAPSSGDGLTDAERDAVYEELGCGRVSAHAWADVRAIAQRLAAAGFAAEDIREQMHEWVEDAVRTIARREVA